MNRTTLLTAAATAAICASLLALQAGRNRGLAKQIDTETESIAQLERRAEFPGVIPGAVSALNPHAPLPGSVEAAVAEARATTTPQERIDRAVERIEALVADIGDVDQSPAELFKVLPDLLRMVQDLDLNEMIAVAEKLDAPLTMGDTDGKGAMKMILMMLAAEQDPERVLQIPDIMENRELRGMVLSSLARKDVKAAQEWMDSSDIPDRQKQQFQQMLAMQALRQDFTSGLAMIRENNDQESAQMLAMLGQFGLPDETLPQVAAALDDPENVELRPQLLGMLMGASMADGGIAAGRERVAELGLSDGEVGEYLTGNIHSLVQNDADAAFDWLAEVQTEEQFATTLPEAIQTWARQDYNAAGEWLGKMDPSPMRDSAVGSYAELVARIDPQGAAVWTAEINDPELRKSAQFQVAAAWRGKDPQAAEVWLKENGIEPGAITETPLETVEPTTTTAPALEGGDAE